MKRILLFADLLMIPTNQRKRSRGLRIGLNSFLTGKAFSCMLLFILFLFSTKNYGQCAYPTGATQVGSTIIYCIDNSGTISNNVPAGRFVLLNVVQGFTYRFRVDDNFGGTNNNEIVSIYNAANNNGLTTSAGSGGVDFNWTATLSGQVKVLISRGGTAPSGCVNDGSGPARLRINLNSIGNSIDSQTAFGTDTWRGHIYNAGGVSPEPFTNANYAGYYDVASETIAESFGGYTACFPVFSQGSQRASMYTEGYAVRYRMKTTKSGCYFVNFRGDDGIRLTLNGTSVFDRWVEQGPTNYSSVLVRLDGDDDFVLDYYENTGQNEVGFSLTPFDANANTITAPTTINLCSNGNPAIIEGSLQYSSENASLQNPQLNFQWQLSTDGGAYANISGATERTYDPPAIANATSANIVRRFKRLVTLNTANVPDINGVRTNCLYNESNVVTITTSPTVPATPGVITGTATVCQGQSGVSYSVPAIANATSYTWSYSGTGFTPSGTTASITGSFSASATSGNLTVRGVNGCGNGTVSATYAITVNPPSAVGAVSANQTICSGSSPSSNVTIASATGTIQWQRADDAAFTSNVINVGTSSTTLTIAQIGALTATRYFRAVVTSGVCSSVTSNTVTIAVNPLPQGSLTANGPFCVTGSGQLTWTATAGTGPYTIIYNDGVANRTVNNVVSGTPFNTFTTPVTATTTYNLVSVTGTGGISCVRTTGFTVGSAIITVNPTSAVGAVSANQTICSGSSPSSNVTIASATGTIQWQRADDATFTTNLTNVGTNSTTLTIAQIGALTATRYFRAVVTSGVCPAVTSGIVTITVNPILPASVSIAITTGTQVSCSGTTVTFTATPTNGGASPTYQWTKNGTNISGATSVTYTGISGTDFVNTDIIGCVMTSNATPCLTGSPATSPGLTMTVIPTPATPVLTNFILTCNQTTASQTWNASSNTSNYIVDVFSDAALTSYLAGYQNRPVTPSASSTESLSINGLLAGQTYYMRVKAVSSCGIESAYSNIVTISLAISQSSDGVTWDNGGLTVNKIAKFTGSSNINVSSAVTACSCIVDPNVNVVIKSPGELILENGLDVKGTLVFENNTSLKQTNPAALNTGSIEYQRKSSPMKNFDFTYWSSPVYGDGIVVPKQTAKNLSPNTLDNKYFRFDPTSGWVFDDGEMKPGVGFIIRVPKPGSPAPDNWSGPTYEQPVTFKGIPNNGTIPFVAGADQFNLIGNPYPSAINAELFMTDLNNKGIIYGPLYFWTHNTPITNNVYASNDYATFNLTGPTATVSAVGNLSPEWIDLNNNKTVDTGEFTDLNANGFLDKLPEWVDANNNNVLENGEWIDSNNNNRLDLPTFEVTANRPTGYIAAGQSFFVGNVGAGSFQFTNAMRVSGQNDKFFKQTNTKKTTLDEKNRVWLNLTNSQGAFKQLLVGYIAGATNDWDNLYDGPSFDGQPFVDFYSINQGKNLTIQGRALPFEATDEVPLGYRSTIAGPFEISIDARDGNLAQQEIWLEDKKTATLHDLAKGKYSFTAINGVENSRFVLKYTNKTLGTDDNTLEDKSLVISIKNKKITVTSSEETITQIQIFDLLGRKIFDKSKINAQEYMIEALPSSEQTLIVKTTLANGAISNKKIIF
ncbi:hypothetical protein SAMN05444143_104178 [Flavobacterium succinicans]|uniref:T9SS sorting signal type C domain-containing protein n=1 Tax=Flavobacterium succinicans TaxID=29536 RepID=A0A1I4V8P1_9FLAO|nr:T9SS sorting signal type C domain-containing protein [Flavobacterium succinicans]SFM97533.1 hypothetical protein SAMN05444143_104178 [Flavobacterium succinicans]